MIWIHTLPSRYIMTRQYGAHSTATDALYAGLPVLTLAGDSFARYGCCIETKSWIALTFVFYASQSSRCVIAGQLGHAGTGCFQPSRVRGLGRCASFKCLLFQVHRHLVLLTNYGWCDCPSAVYLATHPRTLNAVKRRLRASSSAPPALFRTREHSQNLEASWQAMFDVYSLTNRSWHIHVAGT